VAINGGGLSQLYDGGGRPQIIGDIGVFGAGDAPAAPTGVVPNEGTNFVMSDGPAIFILASEDGTISGWNLGPAPTGGRIIDDSERVEVAFVGALRQLRSAMQVGHPLCVGLA